MNAEDIRDPRRENEQFYEFEYLMHLQRPPLWPDWKTLSSLRLSCQALNEVASPVLFRGYYILICSDLTGVSSFPDTILRLIPSQSNINLYVKKLWFSFTGTDFFGTDDPSGPDTTKEAIWDRIANEIPEIIARFPKLDVLRIDTGGFDSPEANYQRLLHLDRCTKLRTGLASALSKPDLQLAKLYLTLLCTHDFEVLCQSIPDSTFQNLQHLFVAIADGTGPGGDDQYIYTGQYDDYYDGDSEIWYSNLQEAYPNIKHQNELFKLVSKCTNLTSLAICGTQHLDADLLDWSPDFSALEHVYLNRIEISADNLNKLFSPAPDQNSIDFRLSAIQCTQVQLKSGTWEQVFRHLETVPTFRYICATNLDYTYEGESAGFREYSTRVSTGGTENILSVRPEDYLALERLWGKLVVKAGGKRGYQRRPTQWAVGTDRPVFQDLGAYPHDPEAFGYERPRVFA